MKRQARTTILGVGLVNVAPRMWRVEPDRSSVAIPADFWGKAFMHHGTSRLGLDGRRWTMQRWSNPANDKISSSLKQAVRVFLRALESAPALSA